MSFLSSRLETSLAASFIEFSLSISPAHWGKRENTYQTDNMQPELCEERLWRRWNSEMFKIVHFFKRSGECGDAGKKRFHELSCCFLQTNSTWLAYVINDCFLIEFLTNLKWINLTLLKRLANYLNAKEVNILENSRSPAALFINKFAIPRKRVAMFLGTVAFPLLNISRKTSII